MKALVYETAHTLDNFAIGLQEVAEPTVREFDVLVEIHAIAINPGETFFRRTRSAEPGGRVLLGWEFAGVVIETGSAVRNFKAGDRVFGTGDLSRDGSWAERLAVDSRIIAKIPDQLSFVDAASLPIGALTAWEAMFRDQGALPTGVGRVLIVGGAGGVGSLATQLLKAKTKAFVISTASRPESRQWCLDMGADLVIDHARDIEDQLASAHISQIDMVLSTAKTADNLGWIANLLRPFGHLSVVDLSLSIDANALMLKSASLHMEMVFSKILNGRDFKSQGGILEDVAALVVAGRVRAIANTRLDGLTGETMRAAHALVETARTIGKVVIAT
ncbi:MAG TPA: zinc-binding alcohol dehydrogenase family protein [Candidatus Acidoferrales bacterium]|jgi:NADPH2:quinone reductase|nr:zinc-binding alcohol dehydrogenase family protein [Candidatus Acidoferrales bacterium]